MLNVKCMRCGAEANTVNHSDPDSAVVCSCCPVDHHHGQATEASGVACRPVAITFTGKVILHAAGR